MKKIRFTLLKFDGYLLFQIHDQYGYPPESEVSINTEIGLVKICSSYSPEILDDNGIFYIYLRGDYHSDDSIVCKVPITKYGLDINALHRAFLYALERSTQLPSFPC